jgi:hypothetical protein
MKPAYANCYEACLIQAMLQRCPQFAWMDEHARRRVGGLSYYGPGKLIGFPGSLRRPCCS